MREIRFVNVTVLLFLLATLSESSAAEAPAPRTLKDLVAKAKESNHTVTVALEATDAEIVKAAQAVHLLEKAVKEALEERQRQDIEPEL